MFLDSATTEKMVGMPQFCVVGIPPSPEFPTLMEVRPDLVSDYLRNIRIIFRSPCLVLPKL